MSLESVMIATRFLMDTVRRNEECRANHNKQNEIKKQHNEAYSKESSSAIRSQVLGNMNSENKEEIKDPKHLLYDYKNGSFVKEYSKDLNCKVVGEEYGIDANDWWSEKMKVEDQTPYYPSHKILHLELLEDTTFCKLNNDEDAGVYANLLVKKTDIENLTPEEMKIKYELPKVPEKICDITVPAGTKVRAGLCNPLRSFGDHGNGAIYDLMGQDVGKIDNERDATQPTEE